MRERGRARYQSRAILISVKERFAANYRDEQRGDRDDNFPSADRAVVVLLELESARVSRHGRGL